MCQTKYIVDFLEKFMMVNNNPVTLATVINGK